MKERILFGCAMCLLVGIAIGALISNSSYKPILMAQAEEIYYLRKEKSELEDKFNDLEIQIKAHTQDMEQFIDQSTLMSVLKQLGIIH